jgi:hypothetical protein
MNKVLPNYLGFNPPSPQGGLRKEIDLKVPLGEFRGKNSGYLDYSRKQQTKVPQMGSLGGFTASV